MSESTEEKRHTYEYAVDLAADTAPARVIRMVGDKKRVLEIGAGPGSITKHLKHASDCQITALELDSEAIKKLSPFCERVYQGNLNDQSWPDLLKGEGRFEVVVAADVLEHLYDPQFVLKQMAAFMKDDGCIIISLPHVGHSAVHACMIEEDFEYRDWGLLDRTHIRFFGIKNIQSLFETAGLKIVQAEFVIRTPEQTEFAERWGRTTPELRRALSVNPFGLVYQVVVKAVPAAASGEAVSLLSMLSGSTAPRSSFIGSAKAAVRPYLSHDLRVRILGVMQKLGIRI